MGALDDFVFVPDGASRRDTATVLVGTADEYGIDQSHIRAAQGGFYIHTDLADVLYSETKTSGNRAAKTSTSTTTGTDKE